MSEGTPRFNRRKDARPGELIAAARQEFAENGYGDAKLARIAKRAGVSNGTLYHYFSDKAELFEAVFQATFVDPIKDGPLDLAEQPSGDPLELALDRLFEEDTMALLSILLFEARRYPEPVGEIADNILAKIEAALTAYAYQSLVAHGAAPSNPFTLVSHGIGIALIERARGHKEWAERAKEASREYRRLLG